MKYLVANWKMNPKSLGQSQALLANAASGLAKLNLADKEVVFCVPFPYLQPLAISYELPANTFLGAQNCGYEQQGAYTGEVSPAMLKDLGVEYVIVGHSERRRFLKEDDEMIAKKVSAAIEAGLTPILCVGSPTQETDQAERETIKKQLEAVFNVSTFNLQVSSFLIAYEPVWAISTSGTGKVATPDQAKSTIDFIRSWVTRYRLHVTCLYGGSVDSNNIKGFMSMEGIDGALVGGASLDAKEFVQLVASA